MAMTEHKWLDVILILGALALGFLLLKPFLTALVFAAVIAYVLYPAHKIISSKIKAGPSALIITGIVACLVVTGIALGIKVFIEEIAEVFISVGNFNFSTLVPNPALASTFKELTRLVVSKVIEATSAVITQIPRLILSVFIFIVSLFFFLRDGKWVWIWVQKKVPLHQDHKMQIFENLRRYAKSFIQVWLLIGILQAIVAAIGFTLFGLPYAILAAFAAMIFSILPIVGPGTLYIPVGIYLILQGHFNAGVSLMIYGLAIGGFLDYVVRPYYTGRWAAIHPLIILLGIFGGLFMLGPAGFIVGPILLLLVIAIIQGTSAGFAKGKHI